MEVGVNVWMVRQVGQAASREGRYVGYLLGIYVYMRRRTRQAGDRRQEGIRYLCIPICGI
jgi:hypothetical protein